MVLDDIKKTFDAVIGQLTPAKAQEMAKRYLEPGAAKEQVARTAGELIDLSQRLREAVRKGDAQLARGDVVTRSQSRRRMKKLAASFQNSR